VTTLDVMPLASDDSTLVCAADYGILRWSDPASHADTLLAVNVLRQADIQKVTALALSARHDLFVLDGVSGMVFRFRRSAD
jgi:hypothetical protein